MKNLCLRPVCHKPVMCRNITCGKLYVEKLCAEKFCAFSDSAEREETLGEINETLAGRYRLLRPLGTGGFATVYLAQDKKSGRYWAVKEIRIEKQRERRREKQRQGQAEAAETASLLQELYHPGLPHVAEIVEQDGAVYVIMDYVQGISLSRILKEQGPQSQQQVVEWGKQLCRIFIYLHNRRPPLIYRDLKPDNIMLQEDGALKLIDFGTMIKSGGKWRNDCLGTRGYAAPEQYVKRGKIDLRTDIYCMGVTLHQMLTGYNPIYGGKELPSIRRWNPSFSLGLERIIKKCTRKSPRRRYRSCKELLRALNKL